LRELDAASGVQPRRRACRSDVRDQSPELLEGSTTGMGSEENEFEARVDRQGLFKLAAAVGAAGPLAGRTGVAEAMRSHSLAESGRLQVLDWAGYGNDGGQSMFAQYVKQHPANKPQFTYLTNESDALAKIHAGLKPDLFRP